MSQFCRGTCRPHYLESLHELFRLGCACQRPIHTSSYLMGRHSRPTVEDARADELPIEKFASEKSRTPLRTYLWGNAQTGAVGVAEYPRPERGSKKPPVLKKHHPIRLPFCELFGIRFRQIACGYGFTLFLTVTPDMQNHQVFVTGVNTDSQLGFHTKRKTDTSLSTILAPLGLDLPLRNRSAKVLQVAAGRAHSVILTEEGCFSLGNNAYGQCGRTIVEKESYANNPRIYKILNLPDDVVKVHCSQDTSYFLTSKGEVYSCGWSADGQRGHGSYATDYRPVRAEGDIAGENIVQISSAADCVLALSDKGDVFGWGNSEYRQLGMVTSSPQTHTPVHLPFRTDIGKVNSVSAGGTVCGLVNEKGAAFTWGFGLLGRGPEEQQCDYPIRLPPGLFEATEFGEKNPLKSIHCGTFHFAITSEKGDLYMWGANDYGQLGLDRLARRIQYFPLKVNLSAKVDHVSLGVDHTGAIARGYM